MVSNWKRLLEHPMIKPSIDSWLTNTDSLTYQIDRDAFRKIDVNPVKMIPQYSTETLPPVLRTINLELLRNGGGICVLTKTGPKRKIKTLFPELPKNIPTYEGHPFSPLYSDSILLKAELLNEESGIFIAIRTGLINAFLVEASGSKKVFSHSGRIKKNIKGTVLIGYEKVLIDSAQMECDAIFESQDIIIPVEAKIGLQKSFSIHQIAFPMILLNQLYYSKKIVGLYLQFEKADKWVFQCYLVEIPYNNQCLEITNYNIIASKEYRIEMT